MEEFQWLLLDRPRIKEREIAGAIPFSPELKKFPDWVLLDRFGRTHCYNDPDAAAAAVANDFTAVPVHTSGNQSGYFSFTLRSPPEVSYVDLHWPYGVPGSVFDLSVFPSVVSSDENLVLLRIVNQNHTALAPELFVYVARPSAPRSPSLQPLPTIGVGQIQGLADRKRFLMVDSDMGILCRSGDPNNYLVADLAVSLKGRPGDYNYTNPPVTPVMDAVLCTFSSKKRGWTVNEMLAPQPHDQGQFPDLWYCDRVLPFAGRFLCWVDYYSGIVFCDFSDEDSPVLRFVHVPGNQQYSNKTLIERYCPESFRNVSVSQGMMRFVHIGNDRRDPNPTSGPTITVWNLMIIGDNWNWEIHHMINLCDLWGQKAYKVLGFPLVPPEFPAVTKDNPDVVCCVLRKERFCGNAWIVNVDMKQVSLRPCVRYINEQIVCNRDAIDDGEYENYFPDVPLLSSDFSRYLNKPPVNGS